MTAPAAGFNLANLNAGLALAGGQNLIAGSLGGLWIGGIDTTTWTSLTPARTLEAVWGSSAQNLWAVGDRQILHYIPAGLTAIPQSQYLYSIWGSGENDIWAVGDQGTMLHYDGSAWSTVQSGINSRLRGICGTSPSDVWAVGEKGVAIHYNGKAWSLPANTGTDKSLNAVWCGAPDNVWLAGDGGLVMHFDGTGFITSHDYDATKLRLLSIWGDGNGVTYAVGESGTVFTLDESVSPLWSLERLNNSSLVDIHKVFGVPAGRPGVCDQPAAVWLAGDSGFLRRLNQHKWSVMTYDDYTDLRGIWANSPCSAWFVGASGTLLRQVGGLHPSSAASAD